MPDLKQCNIERTDLGVRICFGGHARSADCEWVEFVDPSTIRVEGPKPPETDQEHADALQRAVDGVNKTIDAAKATGLRFTVYVDDEFVPPQVRVGDVLRIIEPRKA